MAQNICPQCGAPIDLGATECKFCGEKFATQQANQQFQQQYQQPQQNTQYQQYQQQPQPRPSYQQQPQPQLYYTTAINPAWPVKSKTVAGLLAIFLGAFGVHKFYLGKTGAGLLYLIFCWSYIPGLIGFIEGIIYLCSNDENFQLKHHVRLQ